MFGVSKRTPHRRAATIVEMALVISLVLPLMFAVFEYGRIIMLKQLMDNAAREGARRAVVSTDTHPVTTTADIQNTVTDYLAGQDQLLSRLNIQVYEADSVTGNYKGPWNRTPFGISIAVQIDADYVQLTPSNLRILAGYSSSSPMHLSSKCVMRSEAN